VATSQTKKNPHSMWPTVLKTRIAC
jgi:hypothetical protein